MTVTSPSASTAEESTTKWQALCHSLPASTASSKPHSTAFNTTIPTPQFTWSALVLEETTSWDIWVRTTTVNRSEDWLLWPRQLMWGRWFAICLSFIRTSLLSGTLKRLLPNTNKWTSGNKLELLTLIKSRKPENWKTSILSWLLKSSGSTPSINCSIFIQSDLKTFKTSKYPLTWWSQKTIPLWVTIQCRSTQSSQIRT